MDTQIKRAYTIGLRAEQEQKTFVYEFEPSDMLQDVAIIFSILTPFEEGMGVLTAKIIEAEERAMKHLNGKTIAIVFQSLDGVDKKRCLWNTASFVNIFVIEDGVKSYEFQVEHLEKILARYLNKSLHPHNLNLQSIFQEIKKKIISYNNHAPYLFDLKVYTDESSPITTLAQAVDLCLWQDEFLTSLNNRTLHHDTLKYNEKSLDEFFNMDSAKLKQRCFELYGDYVKKNGPKLLERQIDHYHSHLEESVDFGLVRSLAQDSSLKSLAALMCLPLTAEQHHYALHARKRPSLEREPLWEVDLEQAELVEIAGKHGRYPFVNVVHVFEENTIKSIYHNLDYIKMDNLTIFHHKLKHIPWCVDFSNVKRYLSEDILDGLQWRNDEGSDFMPVDKHIRKFVYGEGLLRIRAFLNQEIHPILMLALQKDEMAIEFGIHPQVFQLFDAVIDAVVLAGCSPWDFDHESWQQPVATISLIRLVIFYVSKNGHALSAIDRQRIQEKLADFERNIGISFEEFLAPMFRGAYDHGRQRYTPQEMRSKKTHLSMLEIIDLYRHDEHKTRKFDIKDNYARIIRTMNSAIVESFSPTTIYETVAGRKYKNVTSHVGLIFALKQLIALVIASNPDALLPDEQPWGKLKEFYKSFVQGLTPNANGDVNIATHVSRFHENIHRALLKDLMLRLIYHLWSNRMWIGRMTN